MLKLNDFHSQEFIQLLQYMAAEKTCPPFFLHVCGPNLAYYQPLMKMMVKISFLHYWYTTRDTNYTSFLSGNSYCKSQHYCAHIVTASFLPVNHIAHNYPCWTSTTLSLFSHLIQRDLSTALWHCLSFLLPYIL